MAVVWVIGAILAIATIVFVVESGIWCPLLGIALFIVSILGAIEVYKPPYKRENILLDEIVGLGVSAVFLLCSLIAAYFSLIKGIGYSGENNLKTLLGVAILFIVTFVGLICFKRSKFQEELERIRKQEENEYKQRKKNLEKAKDRFAVLEKNFLKIVSQRILLDSNIWMNSEYDVLFYELTNALKSANSVIMMPGIQFDEIGNLKNSPDENKRNASRTALKRIEAAQQQNILLLQGVKPVASRYAYADPEFIKYVLYEAAELPNCSGSIFVTDDRELRIRINAIVKERLNKDIFIVSGKDIKETAEQIFKLRRII